MDKTAKRFRDRARIGKAIRRARLAKDLTLREVGGLSGIGFVRWHKWEKGKSSIPAELLPGVAAVVDLTAEQLLPKAA